jgi:hypothetical protein
MYGGQKLNYRRSIGSVYKGPPPYASQDYYRITMEGEISTNGSMNLGADNSDFYAYDDYLGLRVAANNKAYAKFKQRAYDNASVGIALAESRQAMNMIVNRAGQLIQLVRRAKRGGFLNSVGHVSIRRPHNESKEDYYKRLSNWWLEFHFGWEPLYKDIFDACIVLTSPYPQGKRIYGGGQAIGQFKRVTSNSNATCRQTMRVIYSGKPKVNNLNLFRATALGLNNPLAIAWELVPFSFLVDWFYPVGNLLNEFTDWVGLDLLDPQRAEKNLMDSCYQRFQNTGYPAYEWRGKCHRFTRTLGITPSLTPPKNVAANLGPERALTAIALLLQAFDPKSQSFRLPFSNVLSTITKR